MSSIPLVALGVRPPDIANPTDQMAKAVQLRSMIQQQKMIPGQLEAQQQENQARAQEIEQRRVAMEQQKAVNDAYRSSVKVDANGQPNIDTDSLGKALASSGHGSAIPGILEGVAKYQETRGNLMKQQQALQEGSADLLGYAAAAVKDAKYDPHLAHTILDTLGDSPQIKQVRQLIDTNPDAFKQQIDAAISQSPAQQKLANERQVATIRASKPPEGELPLQNVDQMNKALASRYQVLNPGKTLPPEFTLPANATQKDYDRINGSLKDTENTIGTKAQRETADEMRRQTLELSKRNADRQEKNADRKDIDFIDKNYVKPANDAEKSYQMFQDAYNNRNNAKTGAESMLALSTHLATTFGNVKGARVTKDMIEHHLGARGIGDSALVAVQKLTNGDVLSPDQWDAFKTLISNSRNINWQTAKKEADRRGVDITESLPADVKSGAAQPSGAFKAPAGAPAPPSEDGHKLKMNGQVIAVSKGGQWVAP